MVTGANGQLGSEIMDLSSCNNFFFTTKDTLDITNKALVEKYVEINEISIIVNCAAYTSVDKAESEKLLANEINHLAVKYLAQVSKDKNIKLIHLSTDYVFDGNFYAPYKETDVPNPKGVYGVTKLDGEKAILEVNPNNSIIIRTSWLYSPYGNNFVKTMIRLGHEKNKLGIVFDQVGSPTYARDLAKTILQIIKSDLKNKNVEIYHYSNEGVLSWYDFAKEIMEMAKLVCNINPIETYQYPTPALRPYYSLLNKAKIKRDFNIEIPYWKEGLADCLKRLGERCC